MDILFTLVPLLIGAGFIFVFGFIIFMAGKGFAEWSNNNKQPVLEVPAQIVSKRTDTSGSSSSNGGGSVSTWYYATFELSDGQRLEFTLPGKEYGLLAEGDAGMLTHQGTRYKGFQRRA